MLVQEAANILKQMYQTAPQGEKVVRIHLFGIQYADQIRTMSGNELAILAGLSQKYATEISKGRRLASYVSIKTL